MKRACALIDGKYFGDTSLPGTYCRDMWRHRPTRPDPPWLPEADRAMLAGLNAPGAPQEPQLWCNFEGVALRFWSWMDYRYFLWVVGQPNMPRGYRLTGQEKLGTAGNRHWLSRWPTRFRPWAFRRGLVAFLTGGHPATRRYLDWYVSRGGTPPAVRAAGAAHG